MWHQHGTGKQDISRRLTTSLLKDKDWNAQEGDAEGGVTATSFVKGGPGYKELPETSPTS